MEIPVEGRVLCMDTPVEGRELWYDIPVEGRENCVIDVDGRGPCDVGGGSCSYGCL